LSAVEYLNNIQMDPFYINDNARGGSERVTSNVLVSLLTHMCVEWLEVEKKTAGGLGIMKKSGIIKVYYLTNCAIISGCCLLQPGQILSFDHGLGNPLLRVYNVPRSQFAELYLDLPIPFPKQKFSHRSRATRTFLKEPVGICLRCCLEESAFSPDLNRLTREDSRQ
jgi:hypothetical protein